MPARPRLPCQSQPCRRQRACAAPAVRITNHESRVTNHGRPGPPSCGGTPPATPPCVCHRVCASPAGVSATGGNATVPARPRLPCQSQPCRRQRACAAPAVRITNHESRITAVPALPRAGGLPPQRPPVYATVRGRPQLVCPRPGDNATVPARPRLPCQSQPCRRQRACAAPAVRITNHESRLTAVPACRQFRPVCVWVADMLKSP